MPDGKNTEAKQSQSSKVLNFSLRTPVDRIPEASLERAGLLLLDTLGVCIAAQPMEAGIIARDAALCLYSASDPSHQASILFDGRKASRAGAAFAAATQIDNLDAHDGYNLTKGHIGVAAVPALVAVAEGIPALSGRDALAALVVGYEIAGRAAISLHESVSDYHTSGSWNALGVVALAGRLRVVSPEILRHAFGISEYHGPRSQMMREIANPTMLHDGSGMGALVGVSSLIMAEMGFTGAPAITVEAPAAAKHWQDLGHFWQVDDQYIKPYPICRWAHAAIDAVRELRFAHGFAHDQISEIEIRSFHNAVQLYSDIPATTSQAQYSMAFAVAVMAVHGTITAEHISGEGLRDPNVCALVRRTHVIEEARHEERYPIGRWADVTVTLKDGKRFESGDTHARGGPERPFFRSDICDKFQAYAAPVIGAVRAEAIQRAVLSLVDPEVRFAQLSQHLYDAP
jgi:2-methylcitrate dehydratase PrpD